jgi:Putative phage serine protease XkdF
MIINTSRHSAITKVDDDLGIVFGWASVSAVNGRPLIDLQGDIVDDTEILKASSNFMANARLAKVMHEKGSIGEVLHSFPMTAEIMKAFNMYCATTGWMIGMKVHDQEVLKAIREGRLSGFSIAGQYTAKEAA